MKKGTQQKRIFLCAKTKRRPSYLAVFLFAVVLSFPASSETQQTWQSELARIEKLLTQAEYRSSRERIVSLLKNNELDTALRTRLYWLKGVCHISEDQKNQAQASFLKLLAISPQFAPSENTSPKILSVFNETYQNFKKQGGLAEPVKSVFAPLEIAVAGEPIVFQVKIEDSPSKKIVSRLEFHLRRLGNSEFSALDFTKVKDGPNLFQVSIPPTLTTHVENEAIFEYYVDFFENSGNRLGGIGKQSLPLSFDVSTQANLSLNQNIKTNETGGFFSPAVWISAAVIAIAGAVTLSFLLQAPQEGSVRIKIFPS